MKHTNTFLLISSLFLLVSCGIPSNFNSQTYSSAPIENPSSETSSEQESSETNSNEESSFTSETIFHTVTFDSKGGSYIEPQRVAHGEKASKPENPTKESTEVITYEFSHWEYYGEPWVFQGYVVTEDMTLDAVWTEHVDTYTVIYQNWDGTELYKTTLPKNETASYLGEVPTREDANTEFTFAGWEEIYNDTELIIYQATYTARSLGLIFSENKVIGYEGSASAVYIPSEYGGYTIDTIGNSAFSSCHLDVVHLPDTIVTIENSAFFDNNFYSGIELPKYLKNIGEFAFESCCFETVFIPASVQIIGRAAFVNCYYLNSLEVSEQNEYFSSLEGILYNKNQTTIKCFPRGRNQEKFIVKEGVIELEDFAFYNSNHLISIEISSSVEEIGWRSLLYGPSETINVTESNKHYTSYRGVLYNKDKTELIYCPEFQLDVKSASGHFDVPISIKSISEMAFSNSVLGSINLPEGLLEIGYGAFSGCKSLGEITIPKKITTLSHSIFTYCNLRRVELGNNITSIGNYAFYECRYLNEINFSNSLTSIGNYAFYKTAIEEIVLGDNVTSIGDYAFYSCDGWRKVVLGNNITSIGNYAFYDIECISIVIPEKVLYIGDYAFSNSNTNEINMYNGMYLQEIFLEVELKPSGWHSFWTDSDIHLYWSGSWQYDSNGKPIPLD